MSEEIKPGRGGIRSGAGRPKGSATSRSRTQQERDTVAALRIEQLLDQAREGKVQLAPDRLKAIELRYARLRPMLSAIEQTTVDPRDKQDPAELEAKLRALFDARPELFSFLKTDAPAQQTPASALSAEHTTH